MAERSTVLMHRIRSIQKSRSETMGKDLQKRIFPICLNGFTGGKTHVRAALESDWLCQKRSLNARTEPYGPKMYLTAVLFSRFAFTVTEL